VRWINRCLIGCMVLSLGVWFILKTFGPETAWAQSGTKVIRANRFIVEDENGKPRAGLAGLKDDSGLGLWSENGEFRVELSVGKYGPALTLIDEDKVLAKLSVSEDGPGLALNDENGKPIWSAP